MSGRPRPRSWRPVAATAVALAAVAALALPVGPAPAGAQAGDDDRPGDGSGGSGEGGPPRTVELEARVVDLGRRTAASDNSEQVTELPERVTITYASDVLFDTDQYRLNAEARDRVDQLADDLAALGPRRVTIEGHTDDRGTPAHNQTLSERRAESVRARLATQLDDGFTLQTNGYGEARPVAPNQTDAGADDPEGRALNRRVVVSYPTG